MPLFWEMKIQSTGPRKFGMSDPKSIIYLMILKLILMTLTIILMMLVINGTDITVTGIETGTDWNWLVLVLVLVVALVLVLVLVLVLTGCCNPGTESTGTNAPKYPRNWHYWHFKNIIFFVEIFENAVAGSALFDDAIASWSDKCCQIWIRTIKCNLRWLRPIIINIARDTTDPESINWESRPSGTTCISLKSVHPLALVPKLSTRLSHLHCHIALDCHIGIISLLWVGSLIS